MRNYCYVTELVVLNAAGTNFFPVSESTDKAQLCLFGSSKNGFGFRDSDLDICMTLEGHETAEVGRLNAHTATCLNVTRDLTLLHKNFDLSEQRLNCKEIIEGLAKVLKKHTGEIKIYSWSSSNFVIYVCVEDLIWLPPLVPGLRNILPITTAKVPIVKFEHRQSGLEGDISLYNTLVSEQGSNTWTCFYFWIKSLNMLLFVESGRWIYLDGLSLQAQHNTRMLATYAALDPRVQFLGYTMKVFAKVCEYWQTDSVIYGFDLRGNIQHQPK